MSLRSRLVLIVLSVVTLGLIASGVATTTLLRAYLEGRVDRQLDVMSAAAPAVLAQPIALPPDANRPRLTAPPLDNLSEPQAAKFGEDNKIVRTVRSQFSASSDAFSVIPADKLDLARKGHTSTFNVTAPSGHYRVRVVPLSGTRDVAVVVAPLRTVEATIGRLFRIQLLGTFVMLVLTGGAALWLVRVGLKPLRHMADTADAIALGDVERRVEVRGGHEVARLGAALNSAFDEQVNSQAALRKFLSDASHELRTPLTSIRGYAELLRAGAFQDDEQRARAIQRIESEGARMGLLVDDLLALARLDESQPLMLRHIDLAALAADAVHDARVVEPNRPITFVSEGAVPITGDERILRQLFANLLSNVRQHTPSGTPVEVGVVRVQGGARIDVVDDGPGIADADRELVFQRFWRAGDDLHAHTESSGTGLGLAIVAAIASAHGGRTAVAPSGIRGAHIVVELPGVAATASRPAGTPARGRNHTARSLTTH